MTPLILYSFELHQKAVDVLIPHCFYWDSREKLWKYEWDTRKLRPYYILNFGILGFTGSLCTIFLIVANIIDPELFKLNQVIMFMFILGASFIFLLEDVLMLFYGKEFLKAVNCSWSILKRKSAVKKGRVKDFSLKAAIAEEIGKLRKGESVDLYGICMNYIVFSYIFFGTVMPLLAVYEDWDPAYLFLLAIDSPKIFGGLNLASNLFLKANRFLLTFILMESAFMSTRAFTLVILSLAQSITKVLRYLLEMRVSLLQIQRYREFWLCYQLLDKLLRLLLSGFLFLVFLVLVLSFSITFLGWKFLPWNVYTFLPSLSLTFVGFVVFSFKISCLIHETSKSIVNRWKNQARRIIFRFRINKTLQSLRPLYLPVGNVGKMDKEMRTKYFESLMYYIMNFLVAFSDKLQ